MVSGESERGGSEQAESPEWMPASSICSMMPATNTSLPSQSASTSTSIASDEVAVEQQRVLAEHRVDLAGLVVRIARLDVGRDQARQGAEEVVGELLLVADDRHGAAAEHVGRAHDEGQAELGRDEPRSARPNRRCRSSAASGASLSSRRLKRSRSSARSIASGEVPRIGTPACLERAARASAASGRRTAR